MKVLQIISAFYPPYSSGGAAFVAHNISKALAKKGHKVTVYTTNALSREILFNPEQNPCNVDGVQVYYFRNMVYNPQIHIYFSKELVEAIKESIARHDIVHIHEYRSYVSMVTMHYAKKYDVPYVLQAHGQLPRIIEKKSLKRIFDAFFGCRLLRGSSKVIALSQMEAQQYRNMGVPEERIEIIPNGIDLSEYGDLPPEGSFKKKFSIVEDEKMILYLGRIHRIKGLDVLVKAFSNIVEKLDDVKLVIVGPDDGYLSELEALIKALKIEHNVLILGPLYDRDKLEAYVDADVYVLPSRYETFPMAVLEAVACGTPALLTENCGIAEYFRDKVGLVVKPDSNHLSEALLEMLLNQKKRSIFRENCKTVIEKFNISKTVSVLERVYEEIVK